MRKNLDNLNILIVEDDLDVCKKFEKRTKKYKNMSIGMTTGSTIEAMMYISKESPNVIILDLELPEGDGDGLRFLRRLNATEISDSPFIIVITNNASPRVHNVVRKLGADYVVCKYKSDYNEEGIIDFLDSVRAVILNLKDDESSEAWENQENNKNNENIDNGDGDMVIINMVKSEMNRIGINPKHIGYIYLYDSICMLLDGKSMDVIYKNLESVFHKNKKTIRASMQNAIDYAWNHTEPKVLEKEFVLYGAEKIPTVNKFIFHYVNKLSK